MFYSNDCLIVQCASSHAAEIFTHYFAVISERFAAADKILAAVLTAILCLQNISEMVMPYNNLIV